MITAMTIPGGVTIATQYNEKRLKKKAKKYAALKASLPLREAIIIIGLVRENQAKKPK